MNVSRRRLCFLVLCLRLSKRLLPAPAQVVKMFSHSQLKTLALLERVGGSISLVSVLIIFVTYGLIARLRNPRNTFIVFASIANVGASIGCIISQDGLRAGQDSTLCRVQSFLIHL